MKDSAGAIAVEDLDGVTPQLPMFAQPKLIVMKTLLVLVPAFGGVKKENLLQ